MGLKEKLLELGLIQDNVFLDSYVNLIQENEKLQYIPKVTQQHHIIPRCYYRNIGIPVNNDKENLVNLYYKDHILAHYYLALASDGIFKYQNFTTIFIILGSKNFPDDEKDLLEKLPHIQKLYEDSRELGYNPMNDTTVKEKHDRKMRSSEVRAAISNTMKKKVSEGQLFDEQHRKKLSDAAKGNCSIRGRKKIYNDRMQTKFVPADQVDFYILQGWTTQYTGKRKYRRHIDTEILHEKLSKSHLGKTPVNKGTPLSEERKKKLSEHFSNTNWMNNGIEQHQVKKEQQNEYISKGYVYGTIRK
nr:MAG TPA: HNH endonuclease [Caudoviricetes sp.]